MINGRPTTEENPLYVKVSGAGSEAIMAVIAVFILFWACSGWERLDCAIGVKKACDEISMSYEK